MFAENANFARRHYSWSGLHCPRELVRCSLHPGLGHHHPLKPARDPSHQPLDRCVRCNALHGGPQALSVGSESRLHRQRLRQSCTASVPWPTVGQPFALFPPSSLGRFIRVVTPLPFRSPSRFIPYHKQSDSNLLQEYSSSCCYRNCNAKPLYNQLQHCRPALL